MSPMHSTPSRVVSRKRRKSLCNCRIFLAYLLSLLSSCIIIYGVDRSYRERNTSWLSLSCLGVMLIFLGSCLYRSGAMELHKCNYGVARRKQQSSKRATVASHLFESQLSLNMMPQCFTNLDTFNRASRLIPSTSHRYLTLPMDPPPLSPEHPLVEIHPQRMTQLWETNASQSNSITNTNANLSDQVLSGTAQVVNEGVREETQEAESPSVSVPVSEQGDAPVSVSESASHSESTSEDGTPLQCTWSSTGQESLAMWSPYPSDILSVASNGSTAGSPESPVHEHSFFEEASSEYDAGSSDTGSESPHQEPPSYEQVIDFDSSVGLVNNYQTL